MSERFKKCNGDLIAILRIKLPTQIRLIGKIPLIYKKNLLSNSSDFKIPKIENMIITIFYRNYQKELTNLNMANQGSPAVRHPLRSTQKSHSFSAPKIRQFNTKKPHFNTLLHSK